jgi:hypothetical protein
MRFDAVIGGNTVAFRFKRASCVAIGTFNMYIIQPAWLAAVGIIPKHTLVEIYSKLDMPGFRFSSPQMPARWTVTPTRIEIETDRMDEDCGSAMAQVLKELPWTPLLAIGNNAFYHAPCEELASLSSIEVLRKDAPDGFEFAQRSIHYGVKGQDTIFNLQLAITEEALELSANAHTELQGFNSDLAQQAARHFFQHRESAEWLIADLFKASVSHANSNDSLPDENDRGNGKQ